MKLEEIAKETMVYRKTSGSNTDSYSTTMLIQSSWKETSKETEWRSFANEIENKMKKVKCTRSHVKKAFQGWESVQLCKWGWKVK